MPYAKRMSWTEKNELSTDAMGFTHTAIGYPLDYSARAVTFINDTDADIYFTIDPTIDMLKLAPHSYETWDIGVHASLHDKPLLIAKETTFYARYDKFSPPSAGLWVAVECLLPEYGCGGA